MLMLEVLGFPGPQIHTGYYYFVCLEYQAGGLVHPILAPYVYGAGDDLEFLIFLPLPQGSASFSIGLQGLPHSDFPTKQASAGALPRLSRASVLPFSRLCWYLFSEVTPLTT